MSRTVDDVMTRDVVVAHERTPYKDLVKLLATRQVSAVPVVDDRRQVLGVVSEADLLVKQEQPARRFVQLLSARRRRRQRAKAEATVASELMSRPAITIGPDANLADAARRLHAEGVKRLLVADRAGRLLGIVSRADLLKAFLRSDEELRRQIVEGVIFGELMMGPDRFDVDVKDGVVVLQGHCERRSLIPTVVRAVAAVDGVVGVENRLGYDIDDLASPQPGALAHSR
jgi:CBS domain-containing protein